MSAKERRLYKKPYKNITARKTVLTIGLILSILSLVIVAAGAIIFFKPELKFFDGKPLDVFMTIFAIGAVMAVVGLIFAVAGANISKPLARLSFTLALLAFFVAAGFLLAIGLFRTIIPLPAFEHFWPKPKA